MTATAERMLYARLRPTAEQFALSIAHGRASEIACFGARGDGKSWAVLWGMVMHAIEHHRAGHALPVRWLGLRDTFTNHRLSTHATLMEPAWEGGWRLEDQGHVARFTAPGGVELIELNLVGVDSPADAERVRTQAHCLWVEEPAPAYEVSGGISKDLYGIALSSRRLETHARVAAISSNYPDQDDWIWQRFVEAPQPGTLCFQIPKGERASEQYRAELAVAYADNPSLKRRLVDALPGMVVLGEQVAAGFQRAIHAPAGFHGKPDPTATLWIGQDGGLTPTTVFGQRAGQRVTILGAVSSAHDGIRQHVRGLVRPWMSEHTPWALDRKEQCRIVFDPAMNKDGEGDTESNALVIMERELPGVYIPGPVHWLPRIQPLLNLLSLTEGLRIDPVHAKGLVKACEGGWHYATTYDGKVKKDEPVKNHPHSDYGDALLYLLAGMHPSKVERRESRGITKTAFDLFGIGRRSDRAPSRTTFSVFGGKA